MFQKLAQATIFTTSLILVIGRMAFSAHPITIRQLQEDRKPSTQNVFIVSQLQIRRS
jgi:predicted molibdopterin-dependent oxidoreductase YjgC